jgi:hypothetical protein
MRRPQRYTPNWVTVTHRRSRTSASSQVRFSAPRTLSKRWRLEARNERHKQGHVAGGAVNQRWVNMIPGWPCLSGSLILRTTYRVDRDYGWDARGTPGIIVQANWIQRRFHTGSHYLTNAEFGCYDGVHKAWIIVDVESKEEARGILPPMYRSQADIVCLSRFKLEEVEEMLRHHQG